MGFRQKETQHVNMVFKAVVVDLEILLQIRLSPYSLTRKVNFYNSYIFNKTSLQTRPRNRHLMECIKTQHNNHFIITVIDYGIYFKNSHKSIAANPVKTPAGEGFLLN